MARIANYEIDSKLALHDEFLNYNATIAGKRLEGTTIYQVWHWRTLVFEYDYHTKEVLLFRLDPISQTTSTLVGRIIRSLPLEVVERLVKNATGDRTQQRRILSMARMLRR